MRGLAIHYDEYDFRVIRLIPIRNDSFPAFQRISGSFIVSDCLCSGSGRNRSWRRPTLREWIDAVFVPQCRGHDAGQASLLANASYVLAPETLQSLSKIPEQAS